MKEVGTVFGSLTVIDTPDELKRLGKVLCRCVCGREVEVFEGNLRTKRGEICRCQRRGTVQKRMTKHGAHNTPEHRIWTGMRNRCLNPNNRSFPDYGARGVAVCDRWASFEHFLADMGKRPSPRHSIERRDNAGDYEPSNCFWATGSEQCNNKRNNRLLEFDGRVMTATQWARAVGISPDALERRLNLLGWTVEKALTTPARGWGPGHKKRDLS